jgi:methionine aminopeptidase
MTCSSDPSSGIALADGDVVKIHLGAHIDGFAAVSAETIVVGASAENPVTGRKADALKAAWTAAEAAMRTIKVGAKNWAVTDVVNKAAATWNCKPVEGAILPSKVSLAVTNTCYMLWLFSGMLSCQQTQNVIDGKKRIILNPSAAQRTDFEGATFAEDEVYGMDILIVAGEDGKARTEEARTTVYQRDSTVSYQLKMQTSRKVFSDVQKKSGAFPFNIRALEDEKRARLGLQEAVQHSLVKQYEIM